jgi:hypothetical protein
MYIFEKEYAVGFDKREDDENGGGKFLLGFVVKTDKTNLISFQSWRNKKIAVKTISNEPRGKFKIFGNTQRGGDWYGSGRSMVYIMHPEKFVFEISVDNLLQILSVENIVDKELSGEYILAHEGQKLVLIPTSSDLYQTAIKDTEIKKNANIKPAQLVIGDKVILHNKQELVFIGRYEHFQYEHNRLDYKRTLELSRNKNKKYYFVNLDKKGKFDTILSMGTPKIFSISENYGWSKEEIVERVFEYFSNPHKGYAIKSLFPILDEALVVGSRTNREAKLNSKHTINDTYSKIVSVVDVTPHHKLIEYYYEDNTVGKVYLSDCLTIELNGKVIEVDL